MRGCLKWGGIGAVLIIVIIVVVVLATNSGRSGVHAALTQVAAPTAAATTAGSAGSTATSATAGGSLLTIGQTTRVGDAQVTLTKARVSSEQSPTAGNQILLLEYRVTYVGKNTYSLSSLLSFSLYGKDDRKYNPTIATDANGDLDGVLKPQQSILGEVAFDVPTASAPYRADYHQVIGTLSAEWAVPQPAS